MMSTIPRARLHRFAVQEVGQAGGEIPAAVAAGETATNATYCRLVDAIAVLDRIGWQPGGSDWPVGVEDFADEHKKASFLRLRERLVDSATAAEAN